MPVLRAPQGLCGLMYVEWQARSGRHLVFVVFSVLVNSLSSPTGGPIWACLQGEHGTGRPPTLSRNGLCVLITGGGSQEGKTW